MSRWTIVAPEDRLPEDYTIGVDGVESVIVDREEISVSAEESNVIVVWGHSGRARQRAELIIRATELADRLQALVNLMPVGKGLNVVGCKDEVLAARALLDELRAVRAI